MWLAGQLKMPIFVQLDMYLSNQFLNAFTLCLQNETRTINMTQLMCVTERQTSVKCYKQGSKRDPDD